MKLANKKRVILEMTALRIMLLSKKLRFRTKIQKKFILKNKTIDKLTNDQLINYINDHDYLSDEKLWVGDNRSVKG